MKWTSQCSKLVERKEHIEWTSTKREKAATRVNRWERAWTLQIQVQDKGSIKSEACVNS